MAGTYLFLRLHVLVDASIHAAHLPHVKIGFPVHLHHALLETQAAHPAPGASTGRERGHGNNRFGQAWVPSSASIGSAAVRFVRVGERRWWPPRCETRNVLAVFDASNQTHVWRPGRRDRGKGARESIDEGGLVFACMYVRPFHVIFNLSRTLPGV